jgi:hypothetical protein
MTGQTSLTPPWRVALLVRLEEGLVTERAAAGSTPSSERNLAAPTVRRAWLPYHRAILAAIPEVLAAIAEGRGDGAR